MFHLLFNATCPVFVPCLCAFFLKHEVEVFFKACAFFLKHEVLCSGWLTFRAHLWFLCPSKYSVTLVIIYYVVDNN